jgi:hypothetical protein
VARVTRGVGDCHHAAQRVAIHDGFGNAEGIAEVADGVSARLEAPARRVAPVGTAVAGEVQVDDLSHLGEPREVGLEVGVVEASRAAVQEDDGRPLAHRRPVGHERGTVDVEPQALSIDLDVHPLALAVPTPRCGALDGDGAQLHHVAARLGRTS